MRKADRTQILEQAVHRLTFAREISMDAGKVAALLDGLGAWSRAHGDRNGEKSPAEIRQSINAATARLGKILDGSLSAHDQIALAARRPPPPK